MVNTSNIEIDMYIEQLHKLLPELEKRFDVRSLAVFRPYVKNEQDKKSDLELLVEYTEMPGLLGFIELEDYLSDTLGIKVGLVLKPVLKQKVGKDILNEIIPI
ncbi:nucleotidyltransferase family protein [Methanolobus sediminis]|uniref:Nucleotidyltransferase family protein n=1 Tax=Methanolobus sediminis TaxID=3072978 RepID=A0AA51UIN2_9EURY|nr:nucleotidyltransferase family protein [Methanolobus sediminis]WMW24263.1 nucleotidyltransferase family protein [Methanolobus sediminis]